MKILILYAVTAVLFLAVDAIGLKVLVKPVFDRHVAQLLVSPPRLLPAALFYLGYVAGILWFVSIPALRDGTPLAALTGGALLGLFAYGTYELTNHATLRAWSAEQVAVDMLWGAVVTGLAAWAGVSLVRAFAPA